MSVMSEETDDEIISARNMSANTNIFNSIKYIPSKNCNNIIFN